MKRIIPWPHESILAWYKAGNTIQEIADILSGSEWQPYWIQNLGREYHPSQKVLNGMMKSKGYALRKTGAPMERNCFWNGGRIVEQPEGYILVKCNNHPYANQNGYVREHRLVMEELLGRYLEPNEVVHHKDEDPSNNSIDNLTLYKSNGEHLADTLKGKCPNWTEDGKKRILEGVSKPRKKKHDDGK